MAKVKRVTAVIPARGGSKGIPGKNLVELGGVPLVCHSVRVARESTLIDEVVVSSDSAEILEVVSEFDPGVTCLSRPSHLATDEASTETVLLDVLNRLTSMGRTVDCIVLLQPTSPFRLVSQLDAAITQFLQSDSTSLISVSDPTQHPADIIIPAGKKLSYVFRPDNIKRRQDFPSSFFVNGSIYITCTDVLRSTGEIYDLETCLIFEMSKVGSIDIDDYYDLNLARAIIQFGLEKFDDEYRN